MQNHYARIHHYHGRKRPSYIFSSRILSVIRCQALLSDYSAPQATYTLSFASPSAPGVSSLQSRAFIHSSVARIYSIGPPPPLEQKIGAYFAQQPIVKVVDLSGKPVAGRSVIAFSWPESSFSGGSSAYMDINKYTYLSGDTSLPSDDNGIARFTNLAVNALINQLTCLGCRLNFEILIPILCLRRHFHNPMELQSIDYHGGV